MEALISLFLIGVTPASLLVGRPVLKGKNCLGILALAPNSLTLRRRLSIELVLLGVCATGFLLVFPERPWGVDVGLGLLALGFIGLNAKFTRRVVWSQFAPGDGHLSEITRCGAVQRSVEVLIY
jgi:hypothetical protein